MGEPLTVSAGELTEQELLETLRDGQRIVVETEFLGSNHEITLRWDGDTYYCDTPTRLHKHDDEDEMRTCIRNQGYARVEDEE